MSTRRTATQLDRTRAQDVAWRLTTIAQQWRALARETDPDAAQRLAALRAERNRLVAEVERRRQPN